MAEPQMIAVGVIAAACNTTADRVRQVLRTRPHIQPAARAGYTRLFMPEAIEQVRAELRALAARKRKGRDRD